MKMHVTEKIINVGIYVTRTRNAPSSISDYISSAPFVSRPSIIAYKKCIMQIHARDPGRYFFVSTFAGLYARAATIYTAVRAGYCNVIEYDETTLCRRCRYARRRILKFIYF